MGQEQRRHTRLWGNFLHDRSSTAAAAKSQYALLTAFSFFFIRLSRERVCIVIDSLQRQSSNIFLRFIGAVFHRRFYRNWQIMCRNARRRETHINNA